MLCTDIGILETRLLRCNFHAGLRPPRFQRLSIS